MLSQFLTLIHPAVHPSLDNQQEGIHPCISVVSLHVLMSLVHNFEVCSVANAVCPEIYIGTHWLQVRQEQGTSP